MTLREKLIVLRDRAGLSQMALAEQLGISRQAVTRWESGDTTPSMDKLKALAKIYNVSLDWLCSDQCEVPENTAIERETQDVWEQMRNIEPTSCTEKGSGQHRKWLVVIIGTVIVGVALVLFLISRNGGWLKEGDLIPVEDLTSDDVSDEPERGFDFNW